MKSLSIRNIQFTLNEVDQWESLKAYVKSKPTFQYGIACLEEAPKTGHKHIHLYVQFSKPTRIDPKKCVGAHIEVCRGSAQQNIAYIKKDGNIIFEEGEAKMKGGVTIAEIKKMNKEERDQLPGIYYNIVNKINNEEAKDILVDEFHKKIQVFYLWGPSGIGKTKKAIQMIKEAGFKSFNLIKYDGQFWHGVKEQQGAALYDDFRDNHMKPSEFINLIDYNVQLMNVKGSSVKNKYNYIILTSVQDPEELYANVTGEPRKQWLRRITEIIHFQ